MNEDKFRQEAEAMINRALKKGMADGTPPPDMVFAVLDLGVGLAAKFYATLLVASGVQRVEAQKRVRQELASASSARRPAITGTWVTPETAAAMIRRLPPVDDAPTPEEALQHPGPHAVRVLYVGPTHLGFGLAAFKLDHWVMPSGLGRVSIGKA